MQLQIIRHKGIFLTIAALFVVASIVALVTYGLRFGIDFTGGSFWQIEFEEDLTQQELKNFVQAELGASEAIVSQTSDEQIFNIRLKELSESDHQEYATALEEEFGPMTELSFQAIGGVVGQELIRKAIWAIIINLFAIVLYVAYAFRKVAGPISSWKYSLVTLVTLFHDAIIPLGIFALLGAFLGVEVDTNFVVATLVVMGFSVHDTIVVFDRIRENLRIRSEKEGFAQIVNSSINETMARSVNTSLTLLVVLAALFILGASTLNYFILVILIGTVLGTYSSIFVASPLLVLWSRERK
ncbi:MAG: protein translocase subunit SecF [Candidatus Harrisonbacteria bacterium]|nr:protein translocase subunit SecF [Candidatus Harrisonbacteria bacterium]